MIEQFDLFNPPKANMTSTINWTLQELPIKSLKDHPKNPRQIDKTQMQHLENLIKKFGLIDKPIVNKDMTIIGGHQRVKVLKKMKAKTVECWVPDEQLEQADIDHLCIGLNKNQGHWDFEILANEWNELDLLNYGFSEEDFGKFMSENEIGEQAVSLPDSENNLKQMTFTFSNEQAETIERALKISKKLGEFHDTINENSNGNALARIVEMWMANHG